MHHLHQHRCARCGRSKPARTVVCPSCGWMPGQTYLLLTCLLTFIGLCVLGGMGGLLWHLWLQR